MLHQCPRVVFPSHSSLVEQFFPTMVTKTMNRHVLLNLESIATISSSFEFYMLKGGVHTFALVMSYLNDTWTPRHATIRLFDAHEITGSAMVL